MCSLVRFLLRRAEIDEGMPSLSLGKASQPVSLEETAPSVSASSGEGPALVTSPSATTPHQPSPVQDVTSLSSEKATDSQNSRVVQRETESESVEVAEEHKMLGKPEDTSSQAGGEPAPSE